ncbi:MAG: TolC family protein [Pseudomonadota bacterium]
MTNISMKFLAKIWALWIVAYITNIHAAAQLSAPLPSPLTLEYALSLAGNNNNPGVQMAKSEHLLSLSEKTLFESKYDFQVGIYGQLSAVKPSILLPDNYPDRNTDHELNLSVSKRLYDFGRKSNQLEVSSNQLNAANMLLKSSKKTHYLQILQAYFNVILADLEFFYYNEAMAIAYIQYDRAKHKFDSKKISELEFLRIEADYRNVSVERGKSENAQRIKRSILAINLDTPEQLPSDLNTPDLSTIPSFSIKRELPEIKKLQKIVVENNLDLKEINYQITAEKKQQQAYYADKYPIIDGKLEAAWYSRELGGSDQGVATLSIKIPVYQGGEVDARVAISHAKLFKLEALYRQLAMQLRHRVLQSWMSLQNLKQQYQQVQIELSYRELYLDKSRAEYESELKSDLGSAMVFLSAAQLEEKKILYKMAYQWAELDILLASEQLYGYGY